MSTLTAPAVAEGHHVSRSRDEKGAHFGARRRALLLGCAGLFLLLAVAANYGPLHEWRGARARLENRQAQVADLAGQKAQLDAQLKKLSDPGYLEGLVRQDLTYARPGEDVFIVSGLASDSSRQAGASPTAAAAAPRPGILERILSALGRLF